MAESLDNLTSWHSDWSGLKVIVFGLGKTGFSVADTLAELGATVLAVTDYADDLHQNMCEVIGVDISFTDTANPVPSGLGDFGADFVVVSPGNTMSAGEEHARRKLCGCRLAVCSRHQNPRGRFTRLVAQAPREVDISQHGEPALPGPRNQRVTW